MKLVSIFIIYTVLTGCGAYVTERQTKVAAQAYSDLDAAAKYVEKEYPEQPVAWAADAMRQHARNMARAMSLAEEDFPAPRINYADWKLTPEAAKEDTKVNVSNDANEIDAGSIATKVLAGMSLAVLLGKLATTMFKTHPIGQILGWVGNIAGGENPVKSTVHDKLIAALNDYKDIDPDWENNKLYKLLSGKMTQAEKDYIKRVNHG